MKLTNAGQKLMERIGGGFASALAVAYVRADLNNQAKLEAVFSEMFAQYNEMAALSGQEPQ